jgi:WD40 repeat protein
VFSADGLWALSGDDAGYLLLWDVPRRQPVRWLQGHRGRIRCLAFSPGGGQAVSGDTSGVVRLWDVATGQARAVDQEPPWEEAVNCVAFSPDGRLVLGIGGQGKARLWSARTGELLCKLARGSANLRSAAFSPDGAYILAGAREEFKVRRWDVRSGERVPCFAGFAQRHPRIQGTMVAPNARAVLALGYAEEYGPRHRDDSPTFTERTLLGGHWVAYKAVANAADMASPPVTGGRYYLEFWEVATQVGVKAVTVGEEEPLALACSVDGHRVLAGFEDGQVCLYGL